MSPHEKPMLTKGFWTAAVLGVLICVGGEMRPAGAAVRADHLIGADPGRILSSLRPDYRDYINAVRPFSPGGLRSDSRKVYMALVRPGAEHPTSRRSAPSSSTSSV